MQITVNLAGIILTVAAANVLTWSAKLDRRGPRLFSESFGDKYLRDRSMQ